MALTVSLVPTPLTTPILDGSVAIEGVAIASRAAPSINRNSLEMLDGAYDVAEMSLATLVAARSRGAPYVAVPIFPGRRFCHGGIGVRRDSGIAAPSDLKGRRVGLSQYWMTSSVWHRDLLAREYGIAQRDLQWVTTARERLAAVDFPVGVSVERIDGATLDELVRDGRIDAALVPRIDGRSLSTGTAVLPFTDVGAAERDYYRRTGLFPIMHLIVVREPLLRADRTLAQRLVAAFDAAKALALADPQATARLESPFDGEAAAAALPAFGGDPWPYGLAANTVVLEAFLNAAQDQGLTRSRYGLADLVVDPRV
jgi:4,5-dihydroxyphthalate decarboxylase